VNSANPVLNKLGLAKNDRAVVIHADDIGNMQSSLDAYRELLDGGLLTSAATMVPCPWFPATAAFCRANVDHPKLDMGVHLTVTSEWDAYRWGPISTHDPASGLLDSEGYFPSSAAGIHAEADIEALHRELRAQIERALATGIEPTHIDTHMFTLFHPRLIDVYIELGLEYGFPPFLLRSNSPEFRVYSALEWNKEEIAARVPVWEERGLPLFDEVTMMTLQDAENREAQLRQKIDDLQPGLTNLILHPAKDSPELREAAVRDWPSRLADYETFLKAELAEEIRARGVHLLGFRALQDLMPGRGDA
jgi:predicted glycoside hydrolase/deacetylase ChbG (UPF0249 family)